MKIKGILLTVLCVMMCGFFAWQMNGESAFADQAGVVKTSGTALNMRSSMTTAESNIVATIPNGTQVNVLGDPVSSGGYSWYKISYNGKEGYVVSTYITLGTATATTTPAPAATAAPAAAPQTTSITIYRTETKYKKINVAAKLKKTTTISKSTSGKAMKVRGKKVVLKKKKSVRIIAEQKKGKTTWFKIQFKYNKKTRKGYIKSNLVNMKTSSQSNGLVVNVKTALRVRKQPGNKKPYYKVNGREMVLAKKQYVNIIKTRTVKGKIWYRVAFDYYGNSYKGYVQQQYIKLTKTRVQKKVAVTKLSEKDFEQEMTRQGFPDSYKDSLRKLHAQYPYWQFTAFKTGLDWNAAVAGESKLGENLISNSKSSAWKCMDEGAYDASTGKWKVFDGSSWVAASKEAIMYYMDPRNFLTNQGIFQFEQLEYQSQYQTLDGVNKILANTPFSNASFTYTDDVTGSNKEITYASAFLDAAKESGVSPYHLASRVKQEVVTGVASTSIAVTGTTESYPGIFNFYNIGAYSGTSPALNGLKWASTGTTYLRPWNNRYRSIVGGATYIGSNYINRGQNTGYLQKFNVTSTSTYNHQYMTNVEAANSEALKTKNAYNGMLDSVPLVFSIPVYNNMPATCSAPK